MDWIAAFALSVPPSAALVVATRAWIAHRRVADETDRLSRETDARLGRSAAKACATIAADALVKAARYRAGDLKRKPEREEPATKTPFQQWLDAGGARRRQDVQDQVEFAFAYIDGEDSGAEAGDMASAEGAKEILDRLAGPAWHATAIEHAKRAR